MPGEPDHPADANDVGLADYRALAAGLAAAQADSANARAQRGAPGGAGARAEALSRLLVGADGWREAAEALRGRFAPPADGEGEA